MQSYQLGRADSTRFLFLRTQDGDAANTIVDGGGVRWAETGHLKSGIMLKLPIIPRRRVQLNVPVGHVGCENGHALINFRDGAR